MRIQNGGQKIPWGLICRYSVTGPLMRLYVFSLVYFVAENVFLQKYFLENIITALAVTFKASFVIIKVRDNGEGKSMPCRVALISARLTYLLFNRCGLIMVRTSIQDVFFFCTCRVHNGAIDQLELTSHFH